MTKILAILFSVLLTTTCVDKSSLEGRYPSGNKNNEEQDDPNNPNLPPEPPQPGKTYKILFIGNSLTMDATELLPVLLNAAGITNIELYRTFRGASTLPDYNNGFNSDNFCAFRTWKPGWDIWRGKETLDFSPSYAVNYAEYDIVTLQEYSGQKYAWSWSEEAKSAYLGLIEKLNAAHPNHKPEIIALFSHTFGTGYERLVNNFGNDNRKQFEVCAETYRHVLDETPIKKVISPAAVVQNLRTSGINKGNNLDLTRGDLIHSDYALTRFAEAALVFKELITPLTGKKIEDVPFRMPEYYPHNSLHRTPVTDDNFPVIMKAVEYASEKPLQITDMSSYSQTFSYSVGQGVFCFADYCKTIEPVTFPLEFPLGNAVSDVYKQPSWSGYSIWKSSQPQAYAKWVVTSNQIDAFFPTMTFANKDAAISSPSVRGMWTGDYLEFAIPVKNFAAGTKVEMKAPIYMRQAPVFWTFEWLDGNEWKNNDSEIQTADNKFSCKASFALKLGTSYISQIATFENAVAEGYLRIRLKVADGSIQADSATSSFVKRDKPNHTDSDYSMVFYFTGSGALGSAISFNIVK